MPHAACSSTATTNRIEGVSEHSSLVKNSRIPDPARVTWSTGSGAMTGRDSKSTLRCHPADCHGGRREKEPAVANRYRDCGAAGNGGHKIRSAVIVIAAAITVIKGFIAPTSQRSISTRMRYRKSNALVPLSLVRARDQNALPELLNVLPPPVSLRNNGQSL